MSVNKTYLSILKENDKITHREKNTQVHETILLQNDHYNKKDPTYDVNIINKKTVMHNTNSIYKVYSTNDKTLHVPGDHIYLCDQPLYMVESSNRKNDQITNIVNPMKGSVNQTVNNTQITLDSNSKEKDVVSRQRFNNNFARSSENKYMDTKYSNRYIKNSSTYNSKQENAGTHNYVRRFETNVVAPLKHNSSNLLISSDKKCILKNGLYHRESTYNTVDENVREETFWNGKNYDYQGELREPTISNKKYVSTHKTIGSYNCYNNNINNVGIHFNKTTRSCEYLPNYSNRNPSNINLKGIDKNIYLEKGKPDYNDIKEADFFIKSNQLIGNSDNMTRSKCLDKGMKSQKTMRELTNEKKNVYQKNKSCEFITASNISNDMDKHGESIRFEGEWKNKEIRNQCITNIEGTLNKYTTNKIYEPYESHNREKIKNQLEEKKNEPKENYTVMNKTFTEKKNNFFLKLTNEENINIGEKKNYQIIDTSINKTNNLNKNNICIKNSCVKYDVSNKHFETTSFINKNITTGKSYPCSTKQFKPDYDNINKNIIFEGDRLTHSLEAKGTFRDISIPGMDLINKRTYSHLSNDDSLQDEIINKKVKISLAHLGNSFSSHKSFPKLYVEESPKHTESVMDIDFFQEKKEDCFENTKNHMQEKRGMLENNCKNQNKYNKDSRINRNFPPDHNKPKISVSANIHNIISHKAFNVHDSNNATIQIEFDQDLIEFVGCDDSNKQSLNIRKRESFSVNDCNLGFDNPMMNSKNEDTLMHSGNNLKSIGNDISATGESIKDNHNTLPDKMTNTVISNLYQNIFGKERIITKDKLKIQGSLFEDNKSSTNKNILPENPKNTITTGLFQTASGKPCEIDKDKLNKVLSLFGDVTVLPEKPQNAITTNLFQTASGKPCEIDKDKLDKARALFGDSTIFPEKPENTVTTNLFQTASGKPCEIDKDKLNKAFSLFGDSTILLEEPENTVTTNLFQTASGKPCEVDKDKLDKVRSLFQDDFDKDSFLSIEKKSSHFQKITNLHELKYSPPYESMRRNDFVSLHEMKPLMDHNKLNATQQLLPQLKKFTMPKQSEFAKMELEKKAIEPVKKKLNFNINLREHIGLIENIVRKVSRKREFKLINTVTNTAMFLQENHYPFFYTWSKDDYVYYFKDTIHKNYLFLNIYELYECFILITKELQIFTSYDFSWFTRRFRLDTLCLIRKYKNNLKCKYNVVKEQIIKSAITKSLDIQEKELSFEKADAVIMQAKYNSNEGCNQVHQPRKLSDIAVLCDTQFFTNEPLKVFQKEDSISNIGTSVNYMRNMNYARSLGNSAGTLVCKPNNIYNDSEVSTNPSSTLDYKTKEEYTTVEKGNITRIILKTFDMVNTPSPVELLYIILKRYISEKKNKKSVLQQIKEGTLSSKVATNLRVEAILKDETYRLVLSDNFEYLFCEVVEPYVIQLVTSNIIKVGSILRMNSFDLIQKLNEDNSGTASTMRCFLASNNLVDINNKNELSLGITKFKGKKIRSIQSFGSPCTCIDVVVISKSPYTYGIYNNSKKSFFSLHSSLYEKIVYNIRSKLARLAYTENYEKNEKYGKLKNTLNMYMEATPYCIIHAVDFSTYEGIKDITCFDKKVKHVMDAMCQIRIFKMNKDIYDALNKGSRMHIYNLLVQKSNRNNRFPSSFLGNITKETVYVSYYGSTDSFMKKPLSYKSFVSHVIKEQILLSDNADFLMDHEEIASRFGGCTSKQIYVPLAFQSTNMTYIHMNVKRKGNVFKNMEKILNEKGKKESIEIKKEDKVNNLIPSFIFTNLFRMCVLSNSHMRVLRKTMGLFDGPKLLNFDLIPGNFYNISGFLIHYTEPEIKEAIFTNSLEEVKKVMNYKVFLLTSAAYFCCVNISIFFPESLSEEFKKDFENKEREMIKNSILFECDDSSEVASERTEEVFIDNNSILYHQMYNFKEEPISEKKENQNKNSEVINMLKNQGIVLFKDAMFVNYDNHNDIFNFRTNHHPTFEHNKESSKDFKKIKIEISRLINEQCVEYKMNNKVIIEDHKLRSVPITQENVSAMYILYLLIHSKNRSMILTGASLKKQSFSMFLINILNQFMDRIMPKSIT